MVTLLKDGHNKIYIPYLVLRSLNYNYLSNSCYYYNSYNFYCSCHVYGMVLSGLQFYQNKSSSKTEKIKFLVLLYFI